MTMPICPPDLSSLNENRSVAPGKIETSDNSVGGVYRDDE